MNRHGVTRNPIRRGTHLGCATGIGADADCGSGTMLGVTLVLVAAMLLAALAAAGNLVACQARARAVADVAALSAAVGLREGEEDPCALARWVAQANGARLDSCLVEIEDVLLDASVTTQVPFAPRASRTARAGPVDCG